MNIQESVAVCMRKYSVFRGRASRAEFWWWQVFIHLVNLFLAVIDTALIWILVPFGPLGWMLGVVIFLPGLSVTVRRLHDIGKSGWWQAVWLVIMLAAIIPAVVVGLVTYNDLVGTLSKWDLDAITDATVSQLTPVIASGSVMLGVLLAVLIWYIVWMARPGTIGPNKYGPDPMAPDPTPTARLLSPTEIDQPAASA